jgi:hypothetical protein
MLPRKVIKIANLYNHRRLLGLPAATIHYPVIYFDFSESKK